MCSCCWFAHTSAKVGGIGSNRGWVGCATAVAAPHKDGGGVCRCCQTDQTSTEGQAGTQSMGGATEQEEGQQQIAMLNCRVNGMLVMSQGGENCSSSIFTQAEEGMGS